MKHLPQPAELFAAEVQYWRLEPEAWRPVLEAAVAAGLPGVSSYVPWEIHEIAKGEYDFDGHRDPKCNLLRFLALLKELGLKLAYRPGPFCCNEMDYGGHPRRIVTGPKSWMVWQANDEPLNGYQLAKKEGHSPSYLEPGYMAEVAEWLVAVDAVVKPWTADQGGPIITVNLDNEPSYIAKDGLFQGDYNPHVVGPGGRWHQWLAQRYGTPASLPYATRYDSFEAVPAPRAVGADREQNLAWYLDWCAFKEDLMAAYLGELRRLHEANGLTGVHYYTNLNPHRPEGVPTNFRTFAKVTGGLVGYDFYRSPWLTWSGYSSMARVLRLMNATLPLTWSAEFMGGWWYTDMGKGRIPASHTRCMSLAAMANGCQAISWFMFHDRRAWGDSPVSELGHRRENHQALSELVALSKALPTWAGQRVQNDLHLAYVRSSMWHCHLGDPSPCNDGELYQGEPVLWGARAGDAVAEYEALYRLTRQAGYLAGAADLEGGDAELAKVSTLWLPGNSFLSEPEAQQLTRWVRAGGTLIVNRVWPTHTVSGQPLKFLGLAEPPATSQAVGRGRVVWSPLLAGGTAPEAETLAQAQEWRAFLAPLLGRPLADLKRPPVVYENWAKGGGIGEHREDALLMDAIRQRGPGGELLFVINLHQRAVWAELSLREQRAGTLRELGGTGESFTLKAGSSRIPCDTKSVRVFQLIWA